MALFTKKIGTIFIKEHNDVEMFLQKMELLKERAEGNLKQEIEKEIKVASYGKVGEDNIAYELKSSGMDMYVLRDIYLEIDDKTAQIDYIVITRKHVYVIECKNLIGNIEIDNTGSFIRTYELMGKRIKEGIYSPITQNQRHLRVLREICRLAETGMFSKLTFDKRFDSNYKSIVVLANPKTYLNARYAKKEIKNQVIRADQLVEYIKKADSESQEAVFGLEQMRRLAQFFLERSQENKSDYVKKYEKMLECMEQQQEDRKFAPVVEQSAVQIVKESQEKIDYKKEDQEKLIAQLKAFRLEQSKKENIKPYYIFKDSDMMSLIEQMPKNSEELSKISGFGQVKVEKYGKEILNILNQFTTQQ